MLGVEVQLMIALESTNKSPSRVETGQHEVNVHVTIKSLPLMLPSAASMNLQGLSTVYHETRVMADTYTHLVCFPSPSCIQTRWRHSCRACLLRDAEHLPVPGYSDPRSPSEPLRASLSLSLVKCG
jgi:hypothetical protein